MGRPPKPRAVEGVQLTEHLYRDPRGRPGYWRYQRPDGSWKTFRASGVDEANRLADEANAVRRHLPAGGTDRLDRTAIVYHVERYILRREQRDPTLPGKENWRNRRGALMAFAATFARTPIHRLTRQQIAAWWDSLTYHQQGLRHTELRRFFNEMAGEGMTPHLEYNPFTLSDDRPRLYRSAAPAVARERLTVDAFWRIYRSAGDLALPGLQVAMGISLLTTLRRSDVCALRLDTHVQGDVLRQIVGKSAAQRGDVHAARLEWELREHPALATLIQRARELSLRHYRCPFVVSFRPAKKRAGKTKDHKCQVTPDMLDVMFRRARDATGLYADLPAGRTPPTFHEIRALSSAMFGRAGYDVSQIQALMAHTDEAVTRLYQSGQELPYLRIEMQLPGDVLGGGF